MNTRNIIVGALAVLVVAVIFWVATSIFSKETALSADEIGKRVLEQYPGGEIISMDHLVDQYTIQLKYLQGEYELSVDETSGEILSLVQTAEFAPVVEPDPVEGDPLLTEEKIKEIALTHSTGEISSLKLLEEEHLYEAIVLNENNKTIMKIHASTGEIISSSTERGLLTEAEAVKIAIAHLKGGELDDVEFKGSGANRHYLVEVILADDNEATVQVNAITGAVMSVTWDD